MKVVCGRLIMSIERGVVTSRLCKLVKHDIENVYQNKYKLFHKIPRTTEIQWLLETTKQK